MIYIKIGLSVFVDTMMKAPAFDESITITSLEINADSVKKEIKHQINSLIQRAIDSKTKEDNKKKEDLKNGRKSDM